MRNTSGQILSMAAGLAAGAWLCAARVQADVTIEQKMNLDVASMIRVHGGSTTSITADKKREDTDSHCEGVMSLFCGNMHGGDIVRLDRDVRWHLEPDKKRYREEIFATPAQIAEMRAKMQANLEKMRSCPTNPRQQPIDKSKCEMSPPKIDVHRTDDRMSIAGHDTQRTLATLTESCTDKETGDVCDTVVAVEVWLTQDKLPGGADRHSFELAYAKKMGLTDSQGLMSADLAKYLAPYQSQIKQLTDKSSELKGLPMKTSLRVLMGGAQCSASAKMKSNDGSADGSNAGGSSSNGNPMSNVAQAGKAIGSSVGNLVGGLFHKKNTDDSQATANGTTTADGTANNSTTANPSAGSAPANAAPTTAPTAPPAKPDPFAQYAQLATFSTETTSINTDPVAADRFEIPADWKKEEPKQTKGGNDEFTCPKSGT